MAKLNTQKMITNSFIFLETKNHAGLGKHAFCWLCFKLAFFAVVVFLKYGTNRYSFLCLQFNN